MRWLLIAALAPALVAGAGSDQARPAIPAATPTISAATAIAAGGEHTCALSRAGSVSCWGGNRAGQLGDGTTTDRWKPVAVARLGVRATALTAGWRHSCALTSAGGVKCWGHNGFGQLGDGSSTGIRSEPVDVSGLTGGVIAVAAGGDHSCALTAAGGVKCWGQNSNGELGDGTTTDRSAPVDVAGLSRDVAAIAAGGGHSCALSATGAVKCWGFNRLGQLGDGTTTDRTTPVAVFGLGGNVVAIATLVGHSCALLRGGRVKCWGTNASGSLGDGTTDSRLAPVDVVGLGGVGAIVAGGHSCALQAHSGEVSCWGLNDSGQLGDGTAASRSTPVSVSTLGGRIAAIAAGGGHTCAVTSLGGVKCWGSNRVGELGDGTSRSRRRPVDALGFGTAKVVVAVVSASARVTPRRTASISLRCGRETRCDGRVILTAFVKGELVGSAADSVQLELGRRTFSIPAGRTRPVNVTLTGRSFGLLVRLRRLTTLVHVRHRQPAGGNTKALRTITLTAPRVAKR
jgi:alpha-tubulin suppressor-like RCC1 family protein